MDRGHEQLLNEMIKRLDILQTTLASSGGGGGGDATAANQALQITELQNIVTELQGTLDVNVTNPITGFALESTLTAINNKLNSLGQKANATSVPVSLSTEQEAIVQSVDDKLGEVQATPTIYTVLGRLKAIEDLLKRGSTSNITTVDDTDAVSQVLLSANTNRVKAVIVNDSNATLYVAEAATAASTRGNYSYRLLPGDYAIIGDYDGVISGIWDADSVGGASITETVL